jgi:hypothetical protein
MLPVNLTTVHKQQQKAQYKICTFYKAYEYTEDRKVTHDSWTDNYASNSKR